MALKTSITIGAVFAGAQAFTNSQKATQLLGSSIDKLNKKQTTLDVNDKEVEQAQKKIKLLGSALDKIEKRKIKIGEIEANQQAFQSSLMSKLAIGGAIVAPVKVAADFEQSMAKVGAVANASEEELNSLTAKARELGASTSWSASQAAEGMQYLAMAGFSTNQTVSAMPGMLNLASAGAVDLGSAADIASNILSGFGKDAEYMGTLGDILTNTFISSNTSLSSLGETMKYAAPTAAGVGMEVNTLAAMVGKLGDAGIQGSMAGTSLNAMINRLSAPTSEAAKALDELGIKTLDADGNLRDMPTVLAELEQSMGGLGSGVKQDLLSTIFGMEAASKAQILMAQASTGALQEYEQKLLEQGSAQRVAEKQNATFHGSMKLLGSAIESISITIGNVFLPTLSSMATFFAGAIGKAGQLAEQFPTITKVVVGLTVGIGALSIGLSVAGYLFSFAQIGLLKLGNAFTMASTAVKWLSLNLKSGVIFQKIYAVSTTALSTTVRVLGGAFRFAGKSALWLGRALLMNPIGLAVTAIGVAAFTIYKYWEPISNFFSGLWTDIKTAFNGGLSGIGSLILNWSPLGLFYKAFSGVLSWFGIDMPENFSEFGSSMIDGLLGGIMNGLPKLGELVDKVKGWFGFGGTDESKTPKPKLGASVSGAHQYATGQLASPKKPLYSYTQPSQKTVNKAYAAHRPQQNNKINVVVHNPSSTVDVEQAVTGAMGRQFSGVPLTDREY
ncbi:phage tail tape measure protein [Vibrio galatheae]|uniref:phage tail tape measure protein n=1 Tax=Vibrio galatheae TaxID=579748 RepID=UPI0006986D8B|nr:phage tail tape measure protein [Vibrio galatheae]